MKNFTKNDYEIYAGAEPFKCGTEPQIHTLGCGLDIIADQGGVTLNGCVATKDVAFELFTTRNPYTSIIISAAQEWAKELEGLKKHEVIALLTNIGIENLI